MPAFDADAAMALGNNLAGPDGSAMVAAAGLLVLANAMYGVGDTAAHSALVAAAHDQLSHQPELQALVIDAVRRACAED